MADFNPFDIKEAVSILRRGLPYIKAAGSPAGLPGADLGQAIGILDAGAEQSIRGGTVGTDLAECFGLAKGSGATFESMMSVHAAVVAETPISPIAVIVTRALVQQSIVATSQIVAEILFTSRQQVEDYRARLSDAFDRAEVDAADDADAFSYQTLVSLHAAMVRDMTARARPLPLMVSYQFPKRRPTLWIANRLYGDGGRGDELLQENKVVHPLFSPASGRALSR